MFLNVLSALVLLSASYIYVFALHVLALNLTFSL